MSSRTRRVGARARAVVACLVVALPAMVAGCGAFGTEGTPSAPSASATPSAPPVPSAVDAGGPDAPLGDAAAACPVTGKAAFDPAFGVDGILQLPGAVQSVGALGPAGAIYVASQENCGDAQRSTALRKVPLDGSNAGAIVRCFDKDAESPIAFSGDPVTGYLLATRLTSGVNRASLRRLNPDGSDRASTLDGGNYTEATFAQRVPGPTPLDVRGYYLTSGTSKGFLQTIPGSATDLGGQPVAGASYPGKLLVAFLRDAGMSTATLVVKRYVAGASSAIEDPSFGKQELPTPNAEPGSFAPNALIASEGFTAFAVSKAGGSYVVLFEAGGPRPLAPAPGFGVPRIARRCDGKIVMALVEAGGNVAIGRYDGDQLDPTFRATKKASGTVSFLLPLPDGGLVVGMSSGQLLRVSP
ncbi:MAG TPA: hypothetical protein PLR99_04050 [Polyangiaceae bacterium]|nr:hypothetical protein [Polyangiaceae bacterium]